MQELLCKQICLVILSARRVAPHGINITKNKRKKTVAMRSVKNALLTVSLSKIAWTIVRNLPSARAQAPDIAKTEEQHMMHEMNENDENDNVCGFTYKHNQGCDDQASRSLPLSHWCGDCDFGKVCDQRLQIKALPVTEPNATVSSLLNRHFPLQRGRARESKNNTWTWTLIGVIMVFSEICHTSIAQECKRLREVHDDRRITSSCSPVRAGVWVFVVRTCLCLGLLWFVGAWGFWCGPSSHPLTLLKKPKKHRHTKFMKQHTSKLEKFNVEVDVFFHGITKALTPQSYPR